MLCAAAHSGNAWRWHLRRVVAVLCVLLVLVAGAAHLLHSHAAAEAPDAACSLCLVAHLPALAVPVLHAPVLLCSNVLIRPPDRVQVPARPLPFDLSVRPPPAGTTLA